MSRFSIAMNHGVRVLDSHCMLRVDCTPTQAPFAGIPIRTSELCVEEITIVKKWKRLNRLSKIRRRVRTIYTAYKVGPPLFDVPTVVCHPKIFNEIKYRLESDHEEG